MLSSLHWEKGGGFQYNWEAIALRTVVFRPTAKKKGLGEPLRAKRSSTAEAKNTLTDKRAVS